MSRHVRAGLVVFGGVLAGRLLGFVRDLLVSAMFGRTVQADVAVLVMTVPDALLAILVGGAIGAALIPEFKRRPPQEAWQLYVQATRLVLGMAVALTLVLSLGSAWVVRIVAPGVAESAMATARPLVATCLWAVPVTAMVAVSRAFLQSHDRFGPPAVSSFLYNLALVVALAFGSVFRLQAVSVAVVVGACLGLAVQLSPARKYRQPGGDARWLIGRSMVLRFFQALGAGVMLLTMPVVLRSFASRFGDGGMTLAHLASKLVDLPLGVALTSVSVALFPVVAERLAITETRQDGLVLASQGLRVVFSLGLPIALGMGFFALDWARLLYGHGKMTPAETAPIGMFAAVLMVGLLPQALNTLVLTVFDSLRDMATPLVVTGAGLLATCGLSAIAVQQGNLPGLAWVTAGVHWAMLVSLLAVARRRHGADLFQAVFGKTPVVQAAVTGLVFVALAWPLRSMHGPAVVGVLGSVVIGVVAGAVGLTTDVDTRGKLLWTIKGKLKGNR
ncbi:MAG: hypothetical protein KF857_11175 [Fimbriimonadaceae bacterium]|nr:hypothetical protein [Fimbriimonadaceae bacterium]